MHSYERDAYKALQALQHSWKFDADLYALFALPVYFAAHQIDLATYRGIHEKNNRIARTIRTKQA